MPRGRENALCIVGGDDSESDSGFFPAWQRRVESGVERPEVDRPEVN